MTKPIRPSASDAIVAAAFECLNRDPTATLAEIAARAGVGRATLHRHFANRAELLRVLALQALRETDEAAERAAAPACSHTEALQRIMYAMIALGDRHWFLVQDSTSQSPALSEQLKRQQSELHALIRAAKAEQGFAADSSVIWIAHCYDHLIHAAWEMVRATLLNGLSGR